MTKLMALGVLFLTLACSVPDTRPTLARMLSQAAPEELHSHLPQGGRHGLHGMVVFGSGPYFLEHIPMLQEPHDFQIVAQVTLLDKNMKHLFADFSRETHTIKPSSLFSLNDFVSGRRKSFKGDLFEGNFEAPDQASLRLKGITVQVDRYLHIRALPDSPPQESMEVSDRRHTYLLNLISPSRNYQEIRNQSTGWQLWCMEGPDFTKPCSARPGSARVH